MQYAAVDIQYAAAVIQSVTADIHLLYRIYYGGSKRNISKKPVCQCFYQNTEDCAADHAVAIFTIQLQSSTPKF